MINESDFDQSCHRYVDDHPDLTNEPIIMLVFAILYVHIFVLGIVGNVAVLYLTLKNRHLQSVQNIFILNLAASDVLMCLTSLPITPITNVYKTWFFASPVCKLIPLVQGASVFVSTFSLSAIALDRYNLVVRPHRHPLRSRGASVVALLLWIISALVCMPYGWYMDVVRIGGLCGEVWLNFFRPLQSFPSKCQENNAITPDQAQPTRILSKELCFQRSRRKDFIFRTSIDQGFDRYYSYVL
ncbi:unnamed protein product [Nippostrongylus brasiliensis]|uniref:G_PROTEIN_RECEP_F1_2 domain-containing protein n=1 Tax=Nippostrongylus brasiliensis TaxID=27835 RepID=A0A0N4XJN5_NIPBR|nr:unnamed protein product [Nippostrongylus brasiliensis]